MVVITYFHQGFGSYLEQLRGVLGSSRVFLGHFKLCWRVFESKILKNQVFVCEMDPKSEKIEFLCVRWVQNLKKLSLCV